MRERTGSPQATLSSEILLVPARRLTLPLYEILLSSLVPEAEPTPEQKLFYSLFSFHSAGVV